MLSSICGVLERVLAPMFEYPCVMLSRDEEEVKSLSDLMGKVALGFRLCRVQWLTTNEEVVWRPYAREVGYRPLMLSKIRWGKAPMQIGHVIRADEDIVHSEP